MGTGEDHSDLGLNLDDFIFLPYFFPIGVSPGGNHYVEVLKGPRKGWIGSLDHDMYAGSTDLAEFVEDMDDALDDGAKPFKDLDVEKQASLLSDPDIGLLWLHATSMDEFLSCIRCVERRSDWIHGYVEDAPSVTPKT